VKNVLKLALGILTSIGGYLEAGSLGTALQAGAAFRFRLLWAIAVGTVCLAMLTEMSGRLAAVSHHTVIGAVRKRFGFAVQVWPLLAQILIDLLVLACEIGGAAFALELATGISMRIWALPVAFGLWLLLWNGTFGLIENGVAALGLVTLAFPVAAILLHPDWREVARGLMPQRPPAQPAQYGYLAVSILGATISPYLVTFYSSGAVEEKWQARDLMANRLVAALGMSFGSLISMAVVVVAAMVLVPAGVLPQSFRDAAGVLTSSFGRAGFGLFCASLFIGCAGAALELALDVSYIIAQSLGWQWGENQRPACEARFALIYTVALPLAALPALAGVDPLKLTMMAMALTVVALPIMLAPLMVIMNDRDYLKNHTNGWFSNIAVIVILVLAVVLAAAAIPLQVVGG
jgi:Mn2+/Fe2+ NRAMP family transporter